MFHRIIVGFDGTDGGRDALALATSLAAANAAILVVGAFPYEVSPSRGVLGDYAARMYEETQALLDEAVVSSDPRVRNRVILDWSAGRALHLAATDEDADLIVIGSAHRGPIGRVLLGDVSRSTLHGAPCAVAVAPRGYDKRSTQEISKIGVGFNGTDESDAALAVAASIAAETHGELRLLTAVASPIAFAPGYAYTFDWTEIEADNRRYAEQQLAEAKASLEVPAQTEALSGDPGLLLEQLSEQVDLVVAGSRGWGAVRSVVLGSTTDRLVHHAHCPVLVVPGPVAVSEPRPEQGVHA